MAQQPELIAFSQNKIGGVQNFYFNILTNDPYNFFEKKWIFSDRETDEDSKLPRLYNTGYDVVFPIYKNETTYGMAARLQKLISNREGVILTNFVEELSTLHIHRKSRKVVYFICHDEMYLPIAEKFEFLIDVFIAHNIEFYDSLIQMFPHRKDRIFYIPYGVRIPCFKRTSNFDRPLKVVFLARFHKTKGVYDLPLIHQHLAQLGVHVEWTIIGDGPEREGLVSAMQDYGNVRFATPPDNEQVLRLLKEQDIYILPSSLDGLPVSMLEAMSVGCVPLITAFNKGIRRMLPANIGTILSIGDIAGFAEAIISLHSNRQELESRSIMARALVENNYNISTRAKEYFDLFARYKDFKKKTVYRLPRYDGGGLSHPSIPKPLRETLRKILRFAGRKP